MKDQESFSLSVDITHHNTETSYKHPTWRTTSTIHNIYAVIRLKSIADQHTKAKGRKFQ